jgi:sRNA-binding protein
LPAHNARFAVVPAGEGLAFTPRSRRVRPHFVKARVKVRVYPGPCLSRRHALFHRPRCIGRYDERNDQRREKRRLKSARRRNPVDGMVKPLARLPRPQANKAEEADIRCTTKTGQLNSLSTGDTLKVVVGPGAFA